MKLRKILAAVMACSVLLTGCTPQSSAPLSIYQGEAKALAAPSYGETDDKTKQLSEGANNFALKLSGELIKERTEENFICSPYSVWLPLAALTNATDESKTKELMEALGAQGLTVEDINHAASRMLYDLMNEGYKEYEPDFKSSLDIANAIFVDNDLNLNKEFAKNFMDNYRGQSMEVDFQSGEAVREINKWAEENTRGLIPEIVKEFPENTEAALANSIYFSDYWREQFEPEDTFEDIFHAPGGDTTAEYMLREGDSQTYYEDDILQAVPLTFNSGSSMYIMLPKDGDARGLLGNMDMEYFDEIRRDSIYATGKLMLPKFSMDSSNMNLKNAMESMGINLFDKENPGITGLVDKYPMCLTSAVQTAAITVDEKGTTAAAVTLLGIAGSAMILQTEPFEMKCDSPFVFIICGPSYDGGEQILFTGVVENPGQ